MKNLLKNLSAVTTLLFLFVLLTPLLQVNAAKFVIGDRVVVTEGPLNVRATPSLSATPLGTQTKGYGGIVVGGPTIADGFTWWNINYDNAPDGWSVEQYLSKLVYPTVVTISATNITSNSATLNGTINPLGVTTNAFFSWGKTETSLTPTPSTLIGSGSVAVPFSYTISSLEPDTTYVYKLFGVNFAHVGSGNFVTFHTPPLATLPSTPSSANATALSVSSIAFVWQDNASNENGYYVERKTSGASYSRIKTVSAMSGVGQGVYVEDSGLSSNTTYCYRSQAYNTQGVSAYSNESCATTPQSAQTLPTVVTGNASSITTTSAVLNGTINPNGVNSGGFFQWGTSPSFGSLTNSTQVGSGNVPVSVNATILSLAPATQYYYRLVGVGSLSGSQVFGDTKNFTTPGNITLQCSDGIDNDGDRLIDYPSDSGCTDSSDDSEGNTPTEPGYGTLTAQIVVINDDGGTLTVDDFQPILSAGATGTTMLLTHNESVRLSVGLYSVSQTAPFGYIATYSGDCSMFGQVTIGEGEHKTCIIINDDIGTAAVPVTCNLTANPTIIAKGESTTLVWESSNATHASIDNGVGETMLDSSITVSPQQTMIYTATFTGEEETAMCSVNVTVIESESLPACSDGIDNDGDGLVDDNDSGCWSSDDNDENNIDIEIDSDKDCLLDSEELFLGTNNFESDSDNDGISDGAEAKNLDMNNKCEHLTIDLIKEGADPRHKDVYLEIDWQYGYEPKQEMKNMLEEAFANAPVQNIDDTTGINLHIDISNQVSLGEVGKYISFDILNLPGESDFDKIKKNNFSKNREPFYHYALFAEEFSIGLIPRPEVSGISELPGNDIMITINSNSKKAFALGMRLEEMQAVTLMHELGHNLGLEHGGDDSKNNKPNYVSIMNYAFTAQGGIYGIDKEKRIDFSRKKLKSLNEEYLNEFEGIQDNVDYSIYFCDVKKDGEVSDVKFLTKVIVPGQVIDWNCDEKIEDNVHANINKLEKVGELELPFENMLDGYDDWSNIDLKFQKFRSYEDGVRGKLPKPEDEPNSIKSREYVFTEINEIIDNTAPVTSIILSKDSLIFLDEITFKLQAEDNEGGIGVQKTGYSFDNETWNEYTEPVEVTEEGTHTIYYRSTDWFGNIEETKSVTFEIVSARGLVEEVNGWATEEGSVELQQMLQNALDEKYWTDRNTLNKAGGQSVLSHLKNAIKFLATNPENDVRRDRLELALEILNSTLTPVRGGGGSLINKSVPIKVAKNAPQQTTQTAKKPAPVVAGASRFNFAHDLTLGAQMDDVKELQKMLRAEGFFTYPEDTGYFGEMTREAVRAFQQARGIVPATGYVGPLTRAELNKIQAKTQATAEAKEEVSLSTFIELFITMGVIPADKAEQARAAFAENSEN